MSRNRDENGSIWRRNKMGKNEEELCCSKKGKKKGEKYKYPLLCFNEVPDYMKDNEFILKYYRAEWPINKAILSLFRWHNETLNVWTHLLGFLVFVSLTIAHLVDVPQMTHFITIITGQFPESKISKEFSLEKLQQNQEQSLQIFLQEPKSWPFYIFLSGSIFCLLTSTICHLLSCHSQKLNLKLLRFDYIGITIMIITSFFPPIYYIFHCTPHWQFTYLTAITLLGILTIITLLSSFFSTGKYRSFRALLFVLMGLFGLIPGIHALVLKWDDPYRNITLMYESVMACSYLIGALFYVFRIPERWKPGWFDLTGHSHQIFHVFVVMGALAHYGAAQVFLRFTSRNSCTP